MAFTNISAIRDPDDIHQVIVTWDYDNPELSVMVQTNNESFEQCESPFIYPLKRWLSDTVYLIAMDAEYNEIEASDSMIVNADPSELTMTFLSISAIRDPDNIHQVIVTWDFDGPVSGFRVRNNEGLHEAWYSPFTYPLNRWLSDTVSVIAYSESDSEIEIGTSNLITVNYQRDELTEPQNVIATRTIYNHLEFSFDTPAWLADLPSYQGG